MLVVPLLILCAATCTAQETGDLRLVDGDAPYEGRLEIYINGSGWGTICFQSYYRGKSERFGLLEADAACRQLGYTRAAEVGANSDEYDNTLLAGVSCPADAKHIYNDCTYDSSYCRYADAAISYINSAPKSYDLRLVDSQGNTNVSAGRLEIYLDGSWNTICALDRQAAIYACFWTVRGSYHRYGTVTELGFLPGSGNKQKLTCTGYTRTINDCYVSSSWWCSNQDDVALSCVVCDRANFCNGTVECDMCVDECHCVDYYHSYYTHYFDYGSSYSVVQASCNSCVCDENEFKCTESGVCIDDDLYCDRRSHCSDASDETTPACVERIQRASRDLDEFEKLRVGFAVGVMSVVTLMLLVAIPLCLCALSVQLRKIYSGGPQPSPLTTVDPPSDQNTSTPEAITTTEDSAGTEVTTTPL